MVPKELQNCRPSKLDHWKKDLTFLWMNHFPMPQFCIQKLFFIFQVDEELRTYGSATELTGSTATVILIKHGEMICANLGDSRAIASLMGLVKTLSTDHNTSNAQERERVFSMGGNIKENRYVNL